MRSVGLLALSSLVALSVACAAPASDDSGSQAGAATGGSSEDEAGFVYIFSPTDTQPICTGALIADKAVVVARSCAGSSQNLTIGLATSGDEKFATAKVTAMHVPTRGPADIAVLEMDHALATASNLVVHAGLHAGYTIYARQSADGGFFAPGVGWTTKLTGALVSETATQATVLPDATSKAKLCQRDLGAMVCASTENTGFLGSGPQDRCALAGIVVGAPDDGKLDANQCSAEGWKVAPLGLYKDFLSTFAPKLFQPITDTHLIGKATTDAPAGLWGYQTSGTVAKCSVTTTSLSAAKVNEKQAVRGAASFDAMGERAEAVGELGLASKAAPNAITWIPATRGSIVKTAKFDDTFTADIGAAADGNYIVALRVSANGGETWTRCDDAAKPLALNVGAAAPATPDADPTTDSPAAKVNPPVVAHAEPPPAPESTDGEEDTSSSSESSNPATPDKIAAPHKAGASGCSAAPGTNTGGMLPIFGLLLGFAALIRRRR